MFNSDVLEVAIGIIFVFILVSIICTAIREGIESWLKTRAVLLAAGIREILGDAAGNGLTQDLYEHPLVNGLFEGKYEDQAKKGYGALLAWGTKLPSYIPSKNFALAIMDIAARGPVRSGTTEAEIGPAISLDSIRAGITNLGDARAQRAMLVAIDSAQGDINRLQANLEAWFDSGMDRVSGWYKRRTQWVLFAIGMFVAVAMNVNTIVIADFLYRNDEVRAVIVKKAEAVAGSDQPPQMSYEKAKEEINSLELPIGWTSADKDLWTGKPVPMDPARGRFANDRGFVLLGWLLTALAASLGAPFWFDMLNKVMVIRATVKPHEKSPEEASEDRQAPAAPAPVAPVAPAVSPLVVPNPVATTPAPPDGESDVDGCDVDVVDATPDEALPEAEGGVA